MLWVRVRALPHHSPFAWLIVKAKSWQQVAFQRRARRAKRVRRGQTGHRAKGEVRRQ